MKLNIEIKSDKIITSGKNKDGLQITKECKASKWKVIFLERLLEDKKSIRTKASIQASLRKAIAKGDMHCAQSCMKELDLLKRMYSARVAKRLKIMELNKRI